MLLKACSSNKETEQKKLTNCQGIGQPYVGQLTSFLGNYLNSLFLFPHFGMSFQ